MWFQINKSLTTLLQLRTERTFCAFLPAVSIRSVLHELIRMLMIMAPCSSVNRLD